MLKFAESKLPVFREARAKNVRILVTEFPHGSMTNLCPHCRLKPLTAVQLKNSWAMGCSNCGGLWFEGRLLEKHLAVAMRDLRIPEDAEIKGRLCPECQQLMHQFYYPQTYCSVDMCENCKGIWLDHKELEEIRIVRDALRKKGELIEAAPPTGIKGSIIRYIDSALDQLMDFS